MAGGFIKLSRDEAVVELLAYSPNAFLLLTQIAMRARRAPGGLNPSGLKFGQAMVGDYRSVGLTEQGYRTAKEQLVKLGLATFQATTRGTIATLLNSGIYDINLEEGNEQATTPLTEKQQAGNGQSNGQTTTPKGFVNGSISAISDLEKEGGNGQTTTQPTGGQQTTNGRTTTNKKGRKEESRINPSGEGAQPSAGSGNPEHQKLISNWCAYYEKRTGAKYHFQGGRDGKAVKTLITFFQTVEAVRDFVKKCHERAVEGYPFDNAETLHDLANNISKLQAALIKPPKTATPRPNFQPAKQYVRPADDAEF